MRDNSVTKYSILYVEDDSGNRTIFELAFKKHFRVVAVESAQEAFDALERDHFQLVVSDQRMPEMTGVEFLKIVTEKYPEVVKILITGFSDFRAIISAINDCHIYKYVPKPWERKELKITLDDALAYWQHNADQKNLIEELQSKLQEKDELIADLKVKV